MDATVTIGVPVDSVGRSGGTETAPGVLRELLVELLGRLIRRLQVLVHGVARPLQPVGQ